MAVELTAGQRRAVVGARVVDRVELAGDVEHDDAAAFDERELALAGLELIDRTDRYLTRHAASCS
jgi:hypothetical protein